MKNIPRIIALTILALVVSTSASAYKNPGDQKSKAPKAAGCAAAAAFTDLNINNVRCRINTGGDMWWDLLDVARYFIPKNTLKTSMFSASLWIGGLDVNGQLKLAAQRYRGNGNDYWPGPLTIDGAAAVDAETCTKYDKLFRITRSEVDQYLAWWTDKEANPDYTIPKSILEWPAHGDPDKKQSYYLAPFWDEDGDGNYDPYRGDYPYYDIDNSLCPRNPENMFKPPAPTMESVLGIVKGGILADQVIKGDQTLWWVFNDKGNIHSETQGAAIGMEIRAQAFGFATNDEINNMTFYSYEIINRSTFRLTETYFSQWVDTDLGYAWDDYVGCDVLRGLGYCYNGNAVDGTGKDDHYGAQPPAVGVDFFQGPYMDPDGLDNPKYGPDGKQLCDVSINGINFGDSIVDNERFGMRRFVYHNNLGGYWAMTDPSKAAEYYNFLRGYWKDGIKMRYGGNAHPNAGGTGPECDFMFPSDTDPCNWGTGGVQPAGYITGAGGSGIKWTEENAGNEPYDRRFMQSAGPFTLEPGAVNYITVGIPWARASTGGPFASVELLRLVDDKCQALFDNCFKVVDGPDAPDLVAQELDREVILYISNRKTSNNFEEKYKELEPNIPENKITSTTNYIYDTLTGQYYQEIINDTIHYDRYFRFEGYQIYQLIDASVDISEIKNPDKSRLVAQCDIENDIARILNYYFDENLQASVPVLEVNGTNKGIQHSFRVLTDQFASGDNRLVNHKQYYYIAVAYAFNEYWPYSQEPGAPDGLLGQKKPYLAGRKSATGRIQSITAIPHKPYPEAGGTIVNAQYGDGPRITRIEGKGNGGIELEMLQESIDQLMSLTAPPYIVTNPTYDNSKGPINVKVVDPLNVKPGNFTLKFNVENNNINASTWTLTNNTTGETWESETAINYPNEQLILDLGLSIQIQQVKFPGDTTGRNNGFITASMQFDDPTKPWLLGLPDRDDPGPFNWIRSGILNDKDNPTNNDWKMPGAPFDPEEDYEKVLNGTWAPYSLTSRQGESDFGPAADMASKGLANLSLLYSVDVVFTSDKSKWTRCPVVEMCADRNLAFGGARRFSIRESQSVDKDGNPAPVGSGSSTNPNDPNYISEKGMGWFPGYAVNIETGERLNMIFGENSWLSAYNGRDMLWNPAPIVTSLFDMVFGGMHYIYILGHNTNIEPGYPEFDGPAYDAGAWARQWLPDDNFRRYVYANAMWVNIPILNYQYELLATDARVRLRVSRPYQRNWAISGSENPVNDNYPMYTFTTNDIATIKGNKSAAEAALELINVVPNPYYGYSGYETNQLDNRVKFTNLPEKCTISIYNISGTLIRKFGKDDESTFLDWDLKNQAGIPIAGGIYLIHVNVPGVGEKVVKWFGSLRPVDLNSF